MNSLIKTENPIENSPNPVSIEGLEKILFQMKNCVCQIHKKEINGTGFFCKISFLDEFNLLPVLITSNHILNENDIEKNKIIEFTLYNQKESRKIIIDENRKVFSNKKYGITLIEIKTNIDNINNFLDLDNNVINNNNINIFGEKKEKNLYMFFSIIVII